MNFAIIPARAGSKRVPGKNTRNFLGKPIIQRVLETIESTSIFERIIVSTESEELAELVVSFGYEVPFLRPEALATDFATTADVANHAIEYLLAHGASQSDSFFLAYPTSVMMTSAQIVDSRSSFERGGRRFLFTAAPFPSAIERAWSVGQDEFATPLEPLSQSARSQDLTECYFDAGQFYWTEYDGWQTNSENFLQRRIYLLDSLEAIDINTESDWTRAENVFKVLRKNIQVADS